MANKRSSKHPRDLPVSYQLRLPWKYKQQLEREADKQGLSLHQLLLDAIQLAHPEQ